MFAENPTEEELAEALRAMFRLPPGTLDTSDLDVMPIEADDE